MQYIFAIVMMNVGASAALYFGIAGIEKFILPKLFASIPYGSWSVPASWSSWTPSVAIPAAYTAFKISPKLSGASLVGIVGMWGGFMITDFQQPPFIDLLKQVIQSIARP